MHPTTARVACAAAALAKFNAGNAAASKPALRKKARRSKLSERDCDGRFPIGSSKTVTQTR
jgi:hypothetical protein